MRFRPAMGLLCLVLVSTLGGVRLTAASLPAVAGEGGAVVSGHRLATEAGLEMLAAGGNAVDGAAATALALAVVFPEAGNLGGGGFAVVKMGDELATLDFRETAPAAATHDMYLDEKGEPMAERSLVGPLAAGVPGSPAGLFELHRRYGLLPWKRVVEPAVRLADRGFTVDEHLHEVLTSHRDLLARFPETAAVWLPGGEPPAVGATLRLPALAATLRAYAADGPDAIVRGEVARAVAALSSRHGGILTAADLAGYEPVWREPVRFTAYGWEVASMPLPSSGGLILGEVVGMLERLGWQRSPRGGAERAHLLAESFRRAYADRFVMGDPTTSEVTARELLSDDWLDRRAGEVDRGGAGVSTRVRVWPGTEPADTTHLSVTDGRGGLVALTTTLNGLFGCGLFVPELGFLNNEMDDFATAPGRPNLYGLVQGESNAVRPGKRMLSSMSPTVAWRTTAAGTEALALGGRGGSLIPTNTLQVLLNVLVDGDPLQAAVNRPRLHHQWLPDRLLAEPDALAPETLAVLSGLGHEVEVADRAAKVHAVRQLPGGRVEAARDPRGPGWAGVVRADPVQSPAGRSPNDESQVPVPHPAPRPAPAPSRGSGGL